MIFLGIMFGTIGFMFSFPLAMILSSDVLKAKTLTKLTKKQHGIYNFRVNKKQLMPVVKRFTEDRIKVKDKLYSIENGSIYEMTTEGTKGKEIKPAEVNFKSGVPVIYFDLDSMMPLVLVNPKEIQNLPSIDTERVSLVLNKERMIDELETMKLGKQDMMKLIKIGVIMSALAMGVSAYVAYMLFTHDPIILDLQNSIPAIRTQLTNITGTLAAMNA